MRSFKQYSALAEEAVKSLPLPENEFPTLYSPVRYALEAGGKRLRPVLLMMGAEAFGLDAREVMMPAAGIETFHNFTLLHDDVMDHSDMRRGRPAVHRKWNESCAILSGDAMLTLATDWISRVDAAALPRVLSVFNRTAHDVYEGQALDMDFEQRDDVTIDDYLRMIGGKTSALLAGAVGIGALAAGASEKDFRALYDFAYSLGIAFQIKDDWLDVYGDSTVFGKPIGGDILNRKKTYLLIKALSSGRKTADAIAQAYSTLGGEDLIRRVRGIYDEAGIPAVCEETIGEYHARAIESLSGCSISTEASEAFADLACRLASREK